MFDDRLNDAQREAATAEDGPLLVVAGAGSGKTLTLASRVAFLLDRGEAPQRILLLTFTRRAAQEMLERARRFSGNPSAGKVWGGTFHAVANRILRASGRAVGLDPNFTVLDQGDAGDLMDLIRSELGLGRGERRFPRKDTLASIYSRTVNAEEPLPTVLRRAFPWCADELEGIREVFRRYTHRKRDRNLLDYDDLLLHWDALARSSAGEQGPLGAFRHVLVDEYQDTNALQARLLRSMAARGASVTVVGDDAQAIYSFRAATVRNIREFPQAFPGARVVVLDRNYRSGQPILDASNGVIARSSEGYRKSMWTDRPDGLRPTFTTCLDDADQCDQVCKAVLEHRERGIPLRDQAVLFRAAHHSDLLEVELARRNIPFVKYGGLKFLETAHVKDALALLRILENPRDEVSWFRVLQLADGVGPATARRLLGELGLRPTEDAGDEAGAVVRLSDLSRVPPSAQRDVAELATALSECAEPSLPVATQLERLERFLAPIFVRRYESPRERLRDLEQLAGLASQARSREAFLTGLALDPPVSTSDLAGPPLLDEDYLILSTIHSAKGLEWEVVHVLHVADGMIPSDMATGRPEEVEEERRLLYVAMTRARQALHLYFALKVYHRPRGVSDRHFYGQVSRFLPDEVLAAFDRRISPAAQQPPPEPQGDGPGTRHEVDAFLAGLWG